MPKNLNNEDIEDVPVVDDALLETAAELVELPSAAPAAHGPVAGKRALGVKEPIIFKWKLIGTSNGMALTLFKAVEREDVDAQFERIQREGYYTDLKILDAEAKVEQPTQPKGTKKESPRTERGGKGASSTAIWTEVAKRRPSSPHKPTPAKSALKSAVKTSKKKSGGSVGGSKRAAKKK